MTFQIGYQVHFITFLVFQFSLYCFAQWNTSKTDSDTRVNNTTPSCSSELNFYKLPIRGKPVSRQIRLLVRVNLCHVIPEDPQRKLNLVKVRNNLSTSTHKILLACQTYPNISLSSNRHQFHKFKYHHYNYSYIHITPYKGSHL